MAGNGYFNTTEVRYEPKSIEVWDDYDGSSAGTDWDAFTSWNGTPDLPLTFTTGVFDYGLSATVNYLLDVEATFPVNITVYYGDTVDSAGGSIDSPTTINVSPSQSLSAVKARYFQFEVSVDYPDSAGAAGDIPAISSINATLTQELVNRQLTGINSSDLTGSVGARQVTGLDGISGVLSIVTQPHYSAGFYVNADYVVSDDSAGETYTEETFIVPVILVDKSTDPITLNIYDANNSNTRTDCVFDAVVQGLPELSSDTDGNIVQAT